MISKKIILIFAFIIVISSFLALNLSMASNTNLNANEACNTCHGPGATGHVDYSVTLTGAQTVQTGTPAVLTATMQNNGYPLISVSLTLQSSSLYTFQGGSAKKVVGTLARGASQSESWTLVFNSKSDQSTTVTVDFTGEAYAASHMQYTYTNKYSKSIFISTTPRPILTVESTPLPESTLFTGTSNNTGILTVKNTGKVDMTNVLVSTTGPILVNGETNFTIPIIKYDQEKNYTITIDTSKSGVGTITVEYVGVPIQKSVFSIYIRPNPADSFTLFIGRAFGYIAYVLLFLSVVAGAGIYHLKKYISGRKIRILHSDLANLSFTMVIIHAVTLTIPNSPWANSYYFYELLPERIPSNMASLGLFLGRSALVLMYISVFSGYYLAKLIKRYGKRVGISIHMLAYVALIFGFVHTILIGGWEHAYPIIGVILFISILSVGFLKWDAQRMLNRKKKEHERRVALRKLQAAQALEPVNTE